MGFRKDAFATVWSIEQGTDTRTKGRISISRKNKQTGEYEQDFSGFVDFIGTAAARKALSLKEKDRIRLGDVDVTTNYNKEKNITYTNFKIFSFDSQSEIDGGNRNVSAGYDGDPSIVDVNVEEDCMLPF